ncbi:uncharacterized protein CLUP02_17488 [Colletotrichum lupini]|uniref:Uncharacterized protein n=1 Tax=Colletotrichum lupini TaxID=145971 RepID=A0A9Q8SF75_9PEZI|nr:uncharacterized protein CLUP02_17488 [Colletotrichum lupini]UQC75978.1 hypothetical protein CLUP02_17488 [Colletotrichum lupini]
MDSSYSPGSTSLDTDLKLCACRAISRGHRPRAPRLGLSPLPYNGAPNDYDGKFDRQDLPACQSGRPQPAADKRRKCILQPRILIVPTFLTTPRRMLSGEKEALFEHFRTFIKVPTSQSHKQERQYHETSHNIFRILITRSHASSMTTASSMNCCGVNLGGIQTLASNRAYLNYCPALSYGNFTNLTRETLWRSELPASEQHRRSVPGNHWGLLSPRHLALGWLEIGPSSSSPAIAMDVFRGLIGAFLCLPPIRSSETPLKSVPMVVDMSFCTLSKVTCSLLNEYAGLWAVGRVCAPKNELARSTTWPGRRGNLGNLNPRILPRFLERESCLWTLLFASSYRDLDLDGEYQISPSRIGIGRSPPPLDTCTYRRLGITTLLRHTSETRPGIQDLLIFKPNNF